MNVISIDRLDLSLDGFGPEAAEGVAQALPGALQRLLQQRVAHIDSLRLALGHADLGALTVSNAQDPRGVAEAIASRLVDWLDARGAAR